MQMNRDAYTDNCGDTETVGIDCDTANTPSGHFTTTGECYLSDSDRCVHSYQHMGGGNYGNGDSCTITVHGGGTLHDTGSFSTESCCDYVRFGGNTYSGSSGPPDTTVNDGDQIEFHTDGSVTRTGFEFCLV
jgi:hypothetical protein